MICNKCQHKIKEVLGYCPKCGSKIESNNIKAISSGNQSLNLIGDNNEIHIGTLDNRIYENKEAHVQYQYKIGKSKVRIKQVRNISLFVFLTTLAGLIADVVTIFSSIIMKDSIINTDIYRKIFTKLAPHFLILFTLSTVLLIFCSELRRKRFLRILSKWIFAIDLILLKDGTIATVKTNGKCPKCSGRIKIEYNEQQDIFKGVCERNPSEHRFSFDYTRIEEEESIKGISKSIQ